MDFSKLGSLTRSNQIEFKEESFQEDYYRYLCGIGDKSDNQSDNVVLGFRKLRQGLIAVNRIDEFAVGVYKSSLDAAIRASNQDEIRVVLSRLAEITGAEFYKELYQLHLLSQDLKITNPSTNLVRQIQRCLLDCNYFKYFKLLDQSIGYQLLFLQALTSKFRILGFRIISKAYLKLPITKLIEILRFDFESCKSFLHAHKYQVASLSPSCTLNFKSRSIS